MPKDLTVSLQNRPGTLADAAEALGRAGINIDGGCGVATGNEGTFHVLVEDAQGARSALEQAGFQVKDERDVIVQEMPENRPGSLGKALRKIADAGVNLEAIYATADGKIAVVADDVEAVRRAAERSTARA